MYDVAVIGAGCVGCAIARELSRYKCSVLLLEKGSDVASGTSKANSGIVHGGYDAKFGTLKAKLSKEGNEIFTCLSDELGFELKRLGSFVLGFDDEDVAKLKELYENGIQNGIEGMRLLDREEILKMEPHVAKNVTSALYCPSAGVISPYEYTIALAENAVRNGVTLSLESEVKGIKRTKDGFEIILPDKSFFSKTIVNAAGIHGDEIMDMVGERNFRLTAIRGEYILLDKSEGEKVNSILFQTPKGSGKGVLVSRTVHGNIYIGPSYETSNKKENSENTAEILSYIKKESKRAVPDIDFSKAITQFCGIRAVSDSGDFIVEQSPVKGFINAVGISSPGLTTSYPIAKRVTDIIKPILKLKENPMFNPKEPKKVAIANLSADELDLLIKKNGDYGEIVCRCEEVSRAEIVNALKSPVGKPTLDKVKKRTRAGMGRCQGGFCTPKVLSIISKEMGMKVSDIQKNTQGSYVVLGELFEEDENENA